MLVSWRLGWTDTSLHVKLWTLFQDRPPLARSPVDNAQIVAGLVHAAYELVATKDVLGILVVGSVLGY